MIDGPPERTYYRWVRELKPKFDNWKDLRDAIDERWWLREERRQAILGLIEKGFSPDAARKWLQRHPIEEVESAQPRKRTTP